MAGLDFPTLLESDAKVQKRRRPRNSVKNTPANKKRATAGPSSKPSTTSKSHQRRRRPATISEAPSEASESASNRSGDPEALASDFEEPDFILAEIEHEEPAGVDTISSTETIIPKDLIHRLLHHHFQDKDKTIINGPAKEVVCKYVEVFVREALARSAYARQEAEGDGGGDGFLEVEDLEKCAPLLVLDF